MSRHRAVRNLDLDEELADADYEYDDDPYGERSPRTPAPVCRKLSNPLSICAEDISESDRQQLESAYASITDVLGPSESVNNPFTQREVKDALWDAYFDTEAVLDTLMKEAEKRNRKKQGEVTAMIGGGCPSEWSRHHVCW